MQWYFLTHFDLNSERDAWNNACSIIKMRTSQLSVSAGNKIEEEIFTLTAVGNHTTFLLYRAMNQKLLGTDCGLMLAVLNVLWQNH